MCETRGENRVRERERNREIGRHHAYSYTSMCIARFHYALLLAVDRYFSYLQLVVLCLTTCSLRKQHTAQ